MHASGALRVSAPEGGPFGVLVADPPWRYDNWTEAKNGAAASAYATMDSDDIAAVPVGEWAALDAVLALWATWPKLRAALAIMERWRFEYVTAVPWIKVTPSTGRVRTGCGFWSRGASEVLLLGRRGSPRCYLRRGETPPGLLERAGRTFYAPRGAHSRKPDDVQTWLERRHAGPYLELFARRERAGWTCAGLDTGWRLSERGCERVAAETREVVT